jgi:hypothetical protein
MADEVEIGITTIENNIEITSQATDQAVDISVTDNADNVTINVTPSIIEININKVSGSGTGLVTSVNTKIGDVVIDANDIGLGDVDNTGDFQKPISFDTQAALNVKADLIDGLVPVYQLPNFAIDFIDDSQFKVLKTVTKTLQESFDKTDEALFKARGTELSEGGIPSINTDPTKFNITPAVLGQIKDGINYYAISYAGATAIPIDNIAAINTYVYLDNAGVLRQQTTAPTRTDFYTKLFLARFASNGTQLIGLDRLRNPSGQYSNSVRELYDYLISNNVPLRQGLAITGNANLTFNRAAGSVFRFGAGSDATPNTPSFTAINTASFFLGTRSSLAGALITNVPVTQYDNNGLLTTISNNKFVAHRLYFFTTPSLAIQYAQTEYSTLEAAKIGALTETYVTNPAVANGALLGWWIVGKNATDLTNPNTSYFLPFTIGGGGTGVGSGALLASNNLIDVANPITSLLNIGGEPLTNKQNSLAVDGTGAKYPTVDALNLGLNAKSNIDNPTFTNVLSLTANPLNSTVNRIKQVMALNDYWSIFGEASVSDKGIMVFEVGDNGSPLNPDGQQFEFRYINPLTPAENKTVFKIDYNEITALANVNATTFVKTGATATNLLQANGADVTKESLPISTATQTALNLKANNDPAQIVITTTVSITTDTVGNLGKTQNEKNVIIDNGVNSINITVNGGNNFLASYLKHGTGAITFIAGAGRTLALVDGTAVLNGALGSKATISSVGTKDYLSISNAV